MDLVYFIIFYHPHALHPPAFHLYKHLLHSPTLNTLIKNVYMSRRKSFGYKKVQVVYLFSVKTNTKKYTS